MAILCGTDFSEFAAAASEAAAHLARRLRDRLVLVHIGRPRDDDEELPPARAQELVKKRSRTIAQLAEQAERLRALGIEVQEELVAGEPDEALAEYGDTIGAHSILIGTHGRRGFRAWGTGSVAARTAQLSRRPVIVYRGAPDRWAAWGEGKAPLRIMCGVDFSPATNRALDWVRSLTEAGPCEVHLAHILWPPNEQKRQAGKPPADIPHVLHGALATAQPPDMAAVCRRDLETRLAGLYPPGSVLELRSNWGRPADALAEWAEEIDADIIVVATRHLKGIAGLWEGSVAQGVITSARCSVASIPPPLAPT